MSTKHIADNETIALLKRLDRAIRLSDESIRSLCARTHGLDIPERMHHPTLIRLLRHEPIGSNKNMYLQQLLVFLKLLGISLDTFVLDDPGASAVARAFKRLDARDRHRVARVIIDALQDRPQTARHLRALDRI